LRVATARYIVGPEVTMRVRHDDDATNEAPPVGTLEEGEPSSWGPVAEDGGPNPAAAVQHPAPARKFTPAEVPCLRGPCQYYFQATSHFAHGNPAGTFEPGYEPVQRHHMCKAIPGVYLELSADSPIYECNHWDPVDVDELHHLEYRRDRYYLEHPDHKPPPRPSFDDEGVVDLDDEEEDETNDDDRPDPEGD
jgi:hypothetical protein